MAKMTRKRSNIPAIFQDTVRKHPNKTAFIFEGRYWTFREVDEQSNAVANYLSGSGFRSGDVIALFMESSPEFVCLWLGMAKIGVVPALINFNLRMQALAHCIKVAESKAIIFGAELADGNAIA